MASGKLLRRLETNGQEGLSYDLRFTPDGKGLVSLSMTYGPAGHRLSRLIAWDVATGKALKESDGPADMGGCLGLSPDGNRLAWADEREGVHVWDVAAGRPRHHFRGLWGGARFLRFAPDGRTLATGCGDDTVLIWDLSADK